MSQDYRWETFGPDGGVVAHADLPSPTFPTQSEAETWLGEEWAVLLDAGVDAVTLLEAGAVVYGPMSLRPAT